MTATLREAGYAPGNYECSCILCKRTFIGDKRACRCEECAQGIINLVNGDPHTVDADGHLISQSVEQTE